MTYAKIYENLIKAIYAEQNQRLPQRSIVLKPPVLDQDDIEEMLKADAEKYKPAVEERLEIEKPTLIETEKFTFNDIAGLEDVVKEAKKLVLAINHSESYEKWGARRPKGILLYGPPGTGKTLLAKIVAHEAQATFFEVSVADIGSQWHGESEKLMQRVFNKANRAAAEGKKVVIFFDEIEALAPHRDEAYEVTRKVISILLQNMDGMKSNPNVTILAATNMPDSIDPALKRSGRFDKLIEVALPSEEGRTAILKLHMDKAMTRAVLPSELFSTVDLQELAKATKGMSGADISNLINLTIEEKTIKELEGIPWTPITTSELIAMARKLSKQREEKKKIGFIR